MKQRYGLCGEAITAEPQRSMQSTQSSVIRLMRERSGASPSRAPQMAPANNMLPWN